MKAWIFAVLLIFGGIGCFSDPENVLAGIAAIVIGVSIIVYKCFSIKKKHDAEAWVQDREEEHKAAMERATIARAQWDAREREQRQKAEAWENVQRKWQGVTEEHARLLNEIGVAYTIANNLKMPDSPEMQHVIELCMRDIALVEMYIKAKMEIESVRDANGWGSAKSATNVVQNFPTFKRLAIIYEKQEKYDEAIAICQKAIEYGFPDDGTDGQMPGRIARLIKKQGKTRKKIKQADVIVVEDTGAMDNTTNTAAE